jgi:hypothetical protein
MFQLFGSGAAAMPGKDDWVGVYPVGAANNSVKSRWCVGGCLAEAAWCSSRDVCCRAPLAFHAHKTSAFLGSLLA